MSALASVMTETVIPRTGVVVRPARVADAGTIEALVTGWAERGLTIRRSLGDILAGIGDFAVAEAAGVVVACASLEVFGDGAEAEVRSVSVAPGHEGLGAGRAVVGQLLDEARARGVGRVVLLTRSQAFFQRCGFCVIEPGELSRAYLDQQVTGRGRTLDGRTAMAWVARGV